MTKLFIISTAILVQFFSVGQYSDALLWTSTSIKSRITKDLNAELDFQMRFKDNVSEISSLFIQTIIDYELGKNAELAVGYRGSYNQGDYNFETLNRVFIDLNYDQSVLKKLDVTLRLRSQHEFNRLRNIGQFIEPEKETAFRIRYGIKYNLKKWKPSIFNEWFFNPALASFYAYRLNFGLGYKISKRHSIKGGYTIQNGTDSPSITKHIYKIGYSYNLKGRLINN